MSLERFFLGALLDFKPDVGACISVSFADPDSIFRGCTERACAFATVFLPLLWLFFWLFLWACLEAFFDGELSCACATTGAVSVTATGRDKHHQCGLKHRFFHKLLSSLNASYGASYLIRLLHPVTYSNAHPSTQPSCRGVFSGPCLRSTSISRRRRAASNGLAATSALASNNSFTSARSFSAFRVPSICVRRAARRYHR